MAEAPIAVRGPQKNHKLLFLLPESIPVSVHHFPRKVLLKDVRKQGSGILPLGRASGEMVVDIVELVP